jgi:hypothetical protein
MGDAGLEQPASGRTSNAARCRSARRVQRVNAACMPRGHAARDTLDGPPAGGRMIRRTEEDPRRNDPAAAQNGVASPPHQGLRRPDNDIATRDSLKQTDLSDMGLSAEDRLRDRRSNGDERRR